MNNIKYHNYSHYKLPITMDPLKFGKLLDQTNNKFIMQLNTKNIAVINQYDKENFIKIFKNGDLVLEFTDTFISDNSFSRFIRDTKFTFINERLAKTEILSVNGLFTIYLTANNTPLSFTFEPNQNTHPIIYYKYYLKAWFWDIKSWNLVDWIIAIYLNSIIFTLIILLPIFVLNILWFLTKDLEIWGFLFEIFINERFLDNITYSIVCTYPLNKATKGNIVKLRRSLNRNAWEEYKISLNNKIFTKKLFENLIKNSETK